MYDPTMYDWATYIGSIGLFLTLLFLFIRFLPMISIFEMQSLVDTPVEREERRGP
jgi:molybdopterin-containing oxidoreductase family membrane subunit